MQLTEEQQAIIAASGDMKINAVAGSGKTTTLLELARSRPKSARILYLAFNKSVRMEAQRKFRAAGLKNVRIETAHSLAYRRIVSGSSFKLTNGYKSYELVDILGLNNFQDQQTAYILGNHIARFFSCYCNSNHQQMKDADYLSAIQKQESRVFAENHLGVIRAKARMLWQLMCDGKIAITHDFYLKQFQLSAPKIRADYILFDEGQDASPAMLDVFLNQKANRIIVGDTHQQIYSWRYAVNSLEKTDFPSFNLSTSFRFDQEIAALACKIISWKNHFREQPDLKMSGTDGSKDTTIKAHIARTNMSLLIRAIELLIEEKEIDKVYFEGNIHSYTYAEEGASIYDVLHLFNGRKQLIRDRLIKSMPDMSALEDYIEQTEDGQLSMMVEIVKKYKNELPKLIQEIKNKHVSDEAKLDADMIFSTVHRCKGMEYDEVFLEEDFASEQDIIDRSKREDKDLKKLNEEVNLLYVGVTRTKNLLNIPEKFLAKKADKEIKSEKEKDLVV